MTYKSQTTSVRAGINHDTQFGAVTPPIHLSTNFSFAGLGVSRQYDYTRTGNPTRDLLADALAELEGGAGAVVTSSGMSALTLLTFLVKQGQRIVAPHDCYGGTFRLLNALKAQGKIDVSYVDYSDLHQLSFLLSHGVALAIVETPSNPLLRVVDIQAIAQLCRHNRTLLAVDNTFLSPALQNPIKWGADFVIHSTTKYINGHSDVVGGAVVAKTKEHSDELAWWANCLGLTASPFDSFLTLRGLRTLEPRIKVHQTNSDRIVKALHNHPAVKKIYYPGLPSHPGHEFARKQQRGFGAIVSFETTSNKSELDAFFSSLKLFTLAESLGGVESLIAHPATMTHASMTPEARQSAGISDGLIRLSIGIEDADDLVADLEQGLDKILPKPKTFNQYRDTTLTIVL